jgi:transposase
MLQGIFNISQIKKCHLSHKNGLNYRAPLHAEDIQASCSGRFWVFRKTQWIAMFTTDLELSVTQIIEYYGAEKKIESGFKELKQDIGSRTSQCRNAQVVNNHLQFCMMASTITWLYAERLKADPERRHKVKGRTSFAFSDVRRLIAEAALNEDFDRVCPKPGNPTKNSLVAVLLRMVA